MKNPKGLNRLPDSPGIYLFKNSSGKIIYIGKATSLRDRVRSYLRGDIITTRGPIIEKMVEDSSRVDFKKTGSVLEALILEASMIRKYQPIYNTKEKDNKSFNYIVITTEKFPRVLLERGRNLESNLKPDKEKSKTKPVVSYRKVFGPFPNGRLLKEALRIIRKIFPFRDHCRPFDSSKFATTILNDSKNTLRPCFNRQIGLCPGVCTGEINSKEYLKIIRRIEMFFDGRMDSLVKGLEKEMKTAAKNLDFEKATKIRDTLFALKHIRDVTLIGDDIKNFDTNPASEKIRIEAYDIAHIGGQSAVGVMVVVENSEIQRNDGRRFKIRGKNNQKGNDDIANLKEVLERRFNHPEWSFSNMIVIDGGETHRAIAEKFIKNSVFSSITVVSVVKDERHKPRDIFGNGALIEKYRSQILLANNEAHRAAMSYHKTRRNKDFGTLMQ